MSPDMEAAKAARHRRFVLFEVWAHRKRELMAFLLVFPFGFPFGLSVGFPWNHQKLRSRKPPPPPLYPPVLWAK